MPAIINKDAEARTYKSGKWSNTSLDKKDLVKRASALRKEAESWMTTRRDLSDYIYPQRGFFNHTTPNQGSKIDHTKLIDSHATHCVDIMASGMLSGLTSPARQWFNLGLSDIERSQFPPIRLWLETSANILLEIFRRCNIYNMFTSIYSEIAPFGTACAFLDDDYERVLSVHNFTFGEYYIGRDAEGRPNAFHRRFWMTVGQLVATFGLENCSREVQQRYNSNDSDAWISVSMLIEENNDRIPFLKDYSNMKYRSAYWENSSIGDSFLKIGGYQEFPVLAPRWDSTTTTDSYGKGPGDKAIGDVKMLQSLQKSKLIGLDKQTNPPLQVDSTVTNVNVLPGGITRFSGNGPNAGVRTTYEVNINLKDLEATIEKTKSDIDRFFFSNLFMMMLEADRTGREITATEIMEKQSEKVSLLGPILERLEKELLDPLIERAFNVAYRGGLIPPPPEEIKGQNLRINYISVLAQAQKMAGVSNLDNFTIGILEESKINPNSLDLINFDEKNRVRADMLGIPHKIMNTPEEIAGIRKQRSDELKAQENKQSALIAAEAASKGAKAAKDLSETTTTGNSMLDSVGEAMKEANR